MKRMVGIAVIAVFACALFLVPHASAQKFKIVDAWVEPLIGEVGDEFAYYVKVEYIEDLAHGVWCNVTLTYGPNSDKRDCNGSRNKSEYWQLPKRGGTKIFPFKNIYLRPLKSCDDEFKNFTEGRGKVCKWEECWYNFTVIGAEGLYHNTSFPKITLPEPKTKLICPGHVPWCDDFSWTFYVEDKMGGTGNFQILVDNLPLVNGSKNFSPGGGKYTYPEGGYKRRPFNESMGLLRRPFTVVFNYSNLCHDINKSCGGHVVPIPPPEIKAYLDEEVLSEERNNTIYLEEHTNLTFKAKIEDYVEANASLKLDVYKNNESYWNCTWNNRTIKVTPDVPFERECDIPFKKERNNFTLNLSYSRLNEINETYNKTYKLNIIPLSIKFENVSVEPKEGYWDDKFNYSIWVTASIDLDVNLSIYDPCREPEPWIDLGKQRYTEKDVNRLKKLNWTNEEPFKKYCVGRSKFYF